MNAPIVESSSTAPLTRYLSYPQWVIFWLLVAVGTFLRWDSLEVRPYHHDESLHAFYGREFFNNPDTGFYKYIPMLHGPMLYNVLRLAFSTAGVSEWGARTPIALLGTLALLLPLLFRRWLQPTTAQVLTAFMAFSPSLVYWSRFLREDMFVLTGMSMVLYGVTTAQPRFKALLVLLGASIHLCTKENSYVFFALLIGYLLFEGGFERFVMHARALRDGSTPRPWWSLLRPAIVSSATTIIVLVAGGLFAAFLYEWGVSGSLGRAFLMLRREQYFSTSNLVIVGTCAAVFGWLGATATAPTLARALWNNLRQYRLAAFIAFSTATLLFCYLYSAGFRYSQGILDGLWRESIGYWIHHHSIERIPGPFLFHFYTLSWYELPFVTLLILQLFLFYRAAPLGIKIAGGAVLTAGVGAWLFHLGHPVDTIPVWKFFKLKDRLDVVGLIFLLTHSVIVTVTHLYHRERALAFFGYLFFGSFFTYSYLGEKVPWLSLYPLTAGIIYFALYFQAYYSTRPWKQVELSNFPMIFGVFLASLGCLTLLQEGSGEGTPLVAWGIALMALSMSMEILSWTRPVSTILALTLIMGIYNLRAAYLTNFVYAGDAREFMSQVHTTAEFHGLMKHVQNLALVRPTGEAPRLLTTGEGNWPTWWYMRGIEGLSGGAENSQRPDFNYILQDEKTPAENVPTGFKVMRVPLRGWWVPDYEQMTAKRFLTYALNHTPWSTVGYQYIHILVKP